MAPKKKPGPTTFKDSAQEARYRRFVECYLVHFVGARAVIEAGFRVSKAAASTTAARLLADDRVQRIMEERRSIMAVNTEITPEMVVKRFWQIANADPRELSEYRRVNCRHCWGINHAYQWTDGEYRRAVDEAKLAAQRARPDRKKPSRRRSHGRWVDPELDADEVDDETDFPVLLPDNSGGFGFIGTKAPNPECPECFGEGHGETFVKDQRNLSPDALALFAGIKQTKEGLEIKTQDQGAALANVARSLGVFQETNVTFNQSVDNSTHNETHVTLNQVRDELSEIFGDDVAIGAPKRPAIEH